MKGFKVTNESLRKKPHENPFIALKWGDFLTMVKNIEITTILLFKTPVTSIS